MDFHGVGRPNSKGGTAPWRQIGSHRRIFTRPLLTYRAEFLDLPVFRPALGCTRCYGRHVCCPLPQNVLHGPPNTMLGQFAS